MILETMLRLAPVVPVLVIDRLEDAVPLARALVAGGLPLLEITLRTPVALEAIRLIADAVDGAVVGAGTVLTPVQARDCAAAGARFAVSPGFSELLSRETPIPLLPGVSTATEAMAAIAAGHRFAKLFPAEAVGGKALLKALAGPLPHLTFCPTGGVTLENAPGYLALDNVVCVGGSWIAPKALVQAGDWPAIEGLARQAAALSLAS
ncbi:MAG: bifunctional 4-hydroxy-2-oxoglutarate aldolase/2-dehydro-3-deoxy-phosphogluconate aldolase [Caulobacter sp.]|nr:bifunctional 4-hydroxy-2-oxoglutarate aldolase/2-dehydro-3-deoxy-phosphogluconate aldolase [Caulobacter sp.]